MFNVDANTTVCSPAPKLAVSSLAWSPDGHFLLCGSWDGSAYLYEVSRDPFNNLAAEFKAEFPPDTERDALLTVGFSKGGRHVFVAGCSGVLREYDVTSPSTPVTVGQHPQPIRSAHLLTVTGCIATASWDRTLRTWDSRAPRTPAFTETLADKVYAMDVRDECMVVALANRDVHFYNAWGAQPFHLASRQSPLRHQTRCVSIFTDKSGFALGSVEGRCGIQYFEESGSSRSFSFKCHRNNAAGRVVVDAVNDVAWNARGTFATCGSDGGIAFWDKDSKQRLKVLPKVGMPVTVCAFRPVDDVLAYAVGSDWSRGPPTGPDTNGTVLLYNTPSNEVMPRLRR